MTTDNLEGVADVDKTIGRIGPDIGKRRKAIDKEAQGRREHEKHLATGAAAAIKRSKDRRAALDEEKQQLDDIERMARVLIESIDEGTPAASPAPADDEPTVTDTPVVHPEPPQHRPDLHEWFHGPELEERTAPPATPEPRTPPVPGDGSWLDDHEHVVHPAPADVRDDEGEWDDEGFNWFRNFRPSWTWLVVLIGMAAGGFFGRWLYEHSTANWATGIGVVVGGLVAYAGYQMYRDLTEDGED